MLEREQNRSQLTRKRKTHTSAGAGGGQHGRAGRFLACKSKAERMSYAYLFKYIIIGDTGESGRSFGGHAARPCTRLFCLENGRMLARYVSKREGFLSAEHCVYVQQQTAVSIRSPQQYCRGLRLSNRAPSALPRVCMLVRKSAAPPRACSGVFRGKGTARLGGDTIVGITNSSRGQRQPEHRARNSTRSLEGESQQQVARKS